MNELEQNLAGDHVKVAAKRDFQQQLHLKEMISVLSIIFIDLLAIAISFLLAYILRNYLLVMLFPTLLAEKLLAQTLILFWWYPLIFVFALAYEHLYYKRLPFWIEVEWIFKAGTSAFFMTIVLLYLVQISEEVSRSFVLLTWGFSMFLIPLLRFYGKKLLMLIGLWIRPVIIIGNAQTIPLLLGALEREKTMGYNVVGYLASQDIYFQPSYDESESEDPDEDLKYLGDLEQAEEIIVEHGSEDIIIAEPGITSGNILELTNKMQPFVKNIILVPDLFGVSLSSIEAGYFFEEQTVFLQVKNQLSSRLNQVTKRIFDLITGSIAAILLLPFILLTCLAIKLDSKGPVFYISERIGQGGKCFSCYKFRTMFTEADDILQDCLMNNAQAKHEWELYNKLITKDPRVTRLGNILRRFSIDELPQLLNVLKGEMSLVGPRPYLPREKEQIGNWAFDILVGKPGLTGLWQVSGRNKLSFKNRLMLDSWYMKNWSLWLDNVIILKTLRVIIKRDGAY